MLFLKHSFLKHFMKFLFLLSLALFYTIIFVWYCGLKEDSVHGGKYSVTELHYSL